MCNNYQIKNYSLVVAIYLELGSDYNVFSICDCVQRGSFCRLGEIPTTT